MSNGLFELKLKLKIQYANSNTKYKKNTIECAYANAGHMDEWMSMRAQRPKINIKWKRSAWSNRKREWMMKKKFLKNSENSF